VILDETDSGSRPPDLPTPDIVTLFRAASAGVGLVAPLATKPAGITSPLPTIASHVCLPLSRSARSAHF
jgi:hypothetical protein